MQVTPKKNSPLNNVPAKLPGIDLEIDNNDISVVTPKIDQSDAERIHESTTNSFFIPEGNNSGSSVVAALVGDTPLGGVYPIDAAQDCVSPKIEEFDPSKI